MTNIKHFILTTKKLQIIQVEAEMKFHEMKVNLEKSISDDSLQPELDKLMKIIENNQKSKQKWKKLIVDVTNKLEGKVKSLIEENQKLKMSKKSKKV